MFEGFKTIRILLIFATALSFALTGFTFLNIGSQEIAIGTRDAIVAATVTEVVLPENILAGQVVFNNRCKNCHHINERWEGPGLKNVYSRVPDSVWLRSWISNSSQLIASGDPYANALFEEYRHMQMPSFAAMPKEEMDALLRFFKYIDKH
jgi:cytochrome c2